MFTSNTSIVCFYSGDYTLISQHEHLDTAIQKMGNRYLTTMLIAQRIRQLYHGARTQLPRQEGESDFSVAVREIAEGLITLDASSDTFASQRQRQRQ